MFSNVVVSVYTSRFGCLMYVRWCCLPKCLFVCLVVFHRPRPPPHPSHQRRCGLFSIFLCCLRKCLFKCLLMVGLLWYGTTESEKNSSMESISPASGHSSTRPNQANSFHHFLWVRVYTMTSSSCRYSMQYGVRWSLLDCCYFKCWLKWWWWWLGNGC